MENLVTNYELYELSVDFVLSMIRKVVKKAHCLPKVTNYPACTNYPVTNYTAFTVYNTINHKPRICVLR